MKIISVIVAFEDIHGVDTLLSHILLQSTEQSIIVCVDNSINHHLTIQELCKQFSKKHNVCIYYTRNSTNLGSAKGFSIGMQKAYELGADWIWLHDQDGYPLDNCISSFLNAIEKKPQESILAPFVIEENSKQLPYFSANVDKQDNWHSLSQMGDQSTTADIAATAGLLLSRKIIEDIGVYDFNHYFVGMEDFDYCLRAKEKNHKLNIINSSYYFHPNKWEGQQWEKTNIKFFGEWSRNNHTRGGYIYFRIIHTKYMFFISFLYSLCIITLHALRRNNIYFRRSLFAYFDGLIYRYKAMSKISIDISGITWQIYKH